jgi:hypothetical protein
MGGVKNFQKRFFCDVCEREFQTLKKRESQTSKILKGAGVMAGEAGIGGLKQWVIFIKGGLLICVPGTSLSAGRR